jgi:NitT/TauT family transport system ATP-binding protein
MTAAAPVLGSPTRPPVVEARDLTVRFGPATAILNITFSIQQRPERGEFIALIGPSGCGKSTLLNVIAGLLQPSSGELLVDGKPVNGPSRERGMIFQQYSSFPHLTVFKNVMFGMSINRDEMRLSYPQRRERAMDLIQQVGLAGHEKKYPHQLSGGQQQRVAIARSLAIEPRVLLLDEPFSALDEPTRFGMQELLVNLWYRSHPTIFVVTHSIIEAVYLSERIWVFSHGPGQIAYDIRDCIPPTAGIPPAVAQDQPEFKHAVAVVTDAFRAVVGHGPTGSASKSSARG